MLKPVSRPVPERAPAPVDLQQLAGQLRLLYQPVISLRDMRASAVEVLARVFGPDDVLAGPEPLLAAMNSAAASMQLTSAVLHRGLAEQDGYNIGHKSGLCFIFNLPLDVMLHPKLIAMIDAARTGLLPPQQIGFELTERHPVRNTAELGQIVDRLLDAGYVVALDDVTPETPNLDALMRLPLRTIKLDRSVVVDESPAHDAFIRRIVAAAHDNGQGVVAEGIETAEVLRRMQDLGVTHAQGFLFAEPLTALALRDFLQKS